MANNIVPEWLKPYITEEAYIALKEHIEQLDPQSREEMILKYIALRELAPLVFKLNGREEFLWKYIALNILKPRPPQHQFFITSDDEDFMTAEDNYLQVRI